MGKVAITCRECGESVKIPAEQVDELGGCCPVCFRQVFGDATLAPAARRKSRDTPPAAADGADPGERPLPRLARSDAPARGLAEVLAGLLLISGMVLLVSAVLALVQKQVAVAITLGVGGVTQLGLGQVVGLLLEIEKRTRNLR